MALSIGIVGLPNVGKSTLFTALTGQRGLSTSYPFTTINPNMGTVPVPDPRLQKLADIVHSGRIVPATVEFVDIAGLAKGANQGEGLGNKFLSNIRETDAIIEVLRYFSGSDTVFVDGEADPERDSEILMTELVLADLGTIERAIPRLLKDAKREKSLATKLDVVIRLQAWMDEGNRALTFAMTEEEKKLLYDLHLLTMKPVLYVANVDEAQAAASPAPLGSCIPIPISAQFEADIVGMDPEEAIEFLHMIGLEQSGLERLIKAAYVLLGLQSFFTAGEMEVRAWTIPIGAKAPQAAGVIHTDFERGFIKAETIGYNDYIEFRGEAGSRAAGKLRLEGKEYIVQDGDVMHFKFNV